MQLQKTRSFRVFAFTVLLAMGALFVWGALRAFPVLREDYLARRSTKTLQSSFASRSGFVQGPVSQSTGTQEPSSAGRLTDAAAWISIPGTSISYPVLHGKGDDWYLKHLYDGSVNRSGSIFVDERNSGTFTELNTIIYGHRMNNGTMFGQLERFEDPQFLKNHPHILLELPDGTTKSYRIVRASKERSSSAGHAYTVDLDTEEKRRLWWQTFCEVNGLGEDTDPSCILTLSTCVKGELLQRFVVQGIEI